MINVSFGVKVEAFNEMQFDCLEDLFQNLKIIVRSMFETVKAMLKFLVAKPGSRHCDAFLDNVVSK